MKIAFISDIHGNAVALEAVLKDIEKKQVDQICVLGDLCYRGPEPKRSLQLVRSLNANVIKGNADEWVVRGVQKGEVPDQALEMMNKERDWTVSKLDENDMNYLNSLPDKLHFKAEDFTIQAFHAAPDSLFEIILPSESDERIKAALMSSTDSDLYVYAHIHKPYIRYLDGKAVLNIGSVGLPFDGLKKASYAIAEIASSSASISIERVEFDVEKVVKQYEQSEYPNQNMVNIIRNARV